MHKITHIHFVFLTKTAILAISFAESNVNVSSI